MAFRPFPTDYVRPLILDVDGVLADWTTAFTTLAHEVYGVPIISADEVTGFNAHGLTEEENNSLWDIIIHSRTFWTTQPPLITLNDVHAINTRARTQDIYYVTARPGVVARQQTEYWLRNIGIDWPAVVISHDKGFSAAALHAAAILDDRPENIIHVLEKSPETIPVLFNRKHNMAAATPRGAQRVNTVKEFLSLV